MIKRANKNLKTKSFFGSTSSLMDYIVENENSASNNAKKVNNIKKMIKYENKRVDAAKKVIYTCVTGGYDTLYTPKDKIKGYDYVLFTDDKNYKSDFWIVKEIPQELLELDLTRQQRLIKVSPHKYLGQYDMSIWFDANIKLDFDFDNFIKSFVDDSHNVFVKRHPVRKCIYQETEICVKMKKDNIDLMQNQSKAYKSENFPSNFGLAETNFIVRFHNQEDCKKLMDNWGEEIKKWSKRDQLSFNYCVWKNKTSIKYFEPNFNIRVTKHIKKKELPKRKNDSIVKFCIVEFNTPKILDCLIKSINKFVPNNHIYVFENSNKNVFNNTYENVTVFDNTKGQIINFDEFLSKYKNRNKSNGRKNNFGSAKHSLSVDKCMSLINDNFILLDSDVLLKRDVSDFYNDEYMYIAETVTQPLSTIKRIVPFICFINTKLCKKNRIHYFDDNYMHGLMKTTIGDRYDTGASFYMKANKYSHIDIQCEDYITHLKGGSWQKNKLTPSEWLEKYKECWS